MRFTYTVRRQWIHNKVHSTEQIYVRKSLRWLVQRVWTTTTATASVEGGT